MTRAYHLYWWLDKNNIFSFQCMYSTSSRPTNTQHIYIYTYIYIYIYIYRVSEEECATLREGVPYVKVHRYNPKHLCPKLNGYGDNDQRKVWSSGGSMQCTCQLTSLSEVRPWVWCQIMTVQLMLVSWTVNTAVALWMVTSVLASCVTYSAWNTKDNYDISASVFVVQFNGFMSLTS
jgi:hypothetical protein